MHILHLGFLLSDSPVSVVDTFIDLLIQQWLFYEVFFIQVYIHFLFFFFLLRDMQ